MHYKFHLIFVILSHINLFKEVQESIMVDFYIIILKNQYSNSKKKRYKNNYSIFYKPKSMKYEHYIDEQIKR